MTDRFRISIILAILASVMLGSLQLAIADRIPAVLSAADVARYRSIFDHQSRGEWARADKLIAALQDDILLGHVKFQRYMHPTAYTARYEELHLWMKAYADHPDAERLYKLAESRRERGWKPLPEPVHGQYLGGSGSGQPAYISRPYKSERKRSPRESNDVEHVRRVINRFIQNDQPTKAAEYLAQDKIVRLLDQVEIDQLREKIAQSYFLNARDDKAIEFAEAALRKSRDYVPLADWTAGLAAWRSGDIARAARHFVALSEATPLSDWNFTAASWWASRAYLKLGAPDNAQYYLERTATHPRTFYGLLALRQLGIENPFNWDLPELKATEVAFLMKIPAVKRAVALSEVGEYDLASTELRSIFLNADEDLAPQLVTLSERIGAPSVAMRMGLHLWDTEDVKLDAAIYPVPKWKPEEGFKVDRALLYAFMRQESGFLANARSEAGASGLMQIMPVTASYISGDKSLRNGRSDKLLDPAFNLELGQQYLAYLMNNKEVERNLFHLAAAYNGGPGNLKKWKAATEYGDDPLFFIEALPSRETRIFIKRVLTNFWIYRHRMEQDLPGLDQIARGEWPEYQPLDQRENEVADNAGN